MILCMGCNGPFKPKSPMADYCRLCANLPEAQAWARERNRIRCASYYHDTVKPDPARYERRLQLAREIYKRSDNPTGPRRKKVDAHAV